MKRINKSLLYVFLLLGGDFFLFIISEIIETSHYNGPNRYILAINLTIVISLIASVSYLIYTKRVKTYVVGGFLYLILGISMWLYKLTYYCIFIFSDSMEKSFDTNFGESLYFICFLINLFVVFMRIGACCLIKKNFNDVKLLEVYNHEKDHAQFIQSLGTQDGDRLCDDEEITEDKLYSQNKNNPFVSGRQRKDDEEEEICFQTTL